MTMKWRLYLMYHTRLNVYKYKEKCGKRNKLMTRVTSYIGDTITLFMKISVSKRPKGKICMHGLSENPVLPLNPVRNADTTKRLA